MFRMLQHVAAIIKYVYGKAKTGLYQLGVSGSATNLVTKKHGSTTNLVIKIFSQPPHPLPYLFLRTFRTLGTVFVCLRRKGVKGGLITEKNELTQLSQAPVSFGFEVLRSLRL